MMTKAVLASVVVAATLAATAHAQSGWRHDRDFAYYGRPSGSVRVFRIPPGGYHSGGVNVYRLRDYPVWPYAYPPNYRWPYGGVTYVYPLHHRRHRHHDW